MRWLGLALAVAFAWLTPVAPAQASVRPQQVIIVAAPGLRWSDVGPATPALQRLTRTAAVGALSVKAGPAVSCPADGFLTLGAGARATSYGAACGALPVAGRDLARRNVSSRERAQLAALSDALTAAGTCATGSGPLAGLAVGGVPAAGGCPVQLLQAPAVGGSRRTAAAVDAVVASADRSRPPGSTLLVLGVSEAPGDRVAHLHLALATGPAYPRGALRSASTSRSSYVQLIDVAPTVLSLLGLPQPAVMTGQPWRTSGPALDLAGLVDLDRRAVAQQAATVPFYLLTLGTLLLLLAATSPPIMEFVRWPHAQPGSTSSMIGGRVIGGRRRGVALVGTALPAASFLAGLVPWWRFDPPLVALLAVTVPVAAVLAAVAARTSCPVGAVCAITALVLIADLVTGARLQLTSVTGYSPLVAGRFAGIGNVAFGVYAAAGLVATAWLARRRLLPVVGLGAVLVAVDGAPPWGSDVGGVLALLPALVVLALLVTGRRVSAARLAGAGLAGVLLVTGLALLDHTRPVDRRTHLGRFVDQIADGTAGGVLRRKAEAVLGLLFHSPVTALLPVVVAGAVLLLLRPPPQLARAFGAAPAYRQALVALCVASALGFALNDSGAAVPALALVVVLPATVAVVSGGWSAPARR